MLKLTATKLKSSAIFRPMESQQATGRSVDSLVVDVNIEALKHWFFLQLRIYENKLASMSKHQLNLSTVEFWTNKLNDALAPIARFSVGHILCVPPSTACIERLFSVASLVQRKSVTFVWLHDRKRIIFTVESWTCQIIVPVAAWWLCRIILLVVIRWLCGIIAFVAVWWLWWIIVLVGV
jgi:hypothetical protein